MGFHRLTVPTYHGGLPSGYDYVNNAVSGTPAPADGPKAGGNPNDGTYFIAFGEDATSSNSNRANAALAENCDLLDDLFNTSQVVMRYVEGTTGGAVNDIAITGEIYVGGSAETPAVVNDQFTRDGLVHITDGSGNELVINESVVSCSLIHDGSSTNVVGTTADGFYTNPTVRLSQYIPSGTTYRIYYLARRSLSDVIKNKPGEFFTNQVRRMEHVPSGLQLQGMDEKYRRSPTYTAQTPAHLPHAISLVDPQNARGNGAWFWKNSIPITGFVDRYGGGSHTEGTLDVEDYLFGATFAGKSNVLTNDFGAPLSASTQRIAMGSGFVYVGNERTAGTDPADGAPGFFGFLHTTNRSGQTGNATDATSLVSSADVSGDQLTLTSATGWWYKNLSGADRSAFAKGIDVIVVRDSSNEVHYLTAVEFSTDKIATVRYLDGSHPNFAAGSVTIEDWYSPLFYSAENAAGYFNQLGLGNTLPPEHAGVMVIEPPIVDSASSPYGPRHYLRLYARDRSRGSVALGWGGFEELNPTSINGSRHDELSWLLADGGAWFTGSVYLANLLEIEAKSTSLTDRLAPKATFNEGAGGAAFYNLVYEADCPISGGTDNGKHRVYQHSYYMVRTFNARWTGTQWEADNTGNPAFHEVLHPTYGYQKSFKKTTSSPWTTWDDNDAQDGVGFKYIAFDTGDTIDTVAGDGAWHPINRSSAPAGNLEVTFGSLSETYKLAITATVQLANSSPSSGTAIAARLEVDWNDGGGWVAVEGSERRKDFTEYTSGYDEFWTLVGVADTATSANRATVKVRVAVLATNGTISFAYGQTLRVQALTVGS